MGDREGAGQPIGAEREAEVGWEEPRERQKEKEKERKGERGGGGHTHRELQGAGLRGREETRG